MTAKTSTERSRDYRARQKTVKALEEVRGLWAPKRMHRQLKAGVAFLIANFDRIVK